MYIDIIMARLSTGSGYEMDLILLDNIEVEEARGFWFLQFVGVNHICGYALRSK